MRARDNTYTNTNLAPQAPFSPPSALVCLCVQVLVQVLVLVLMFVSVLLLVSALVLNLI